jgi:tRNA (guanine-N7-)-methyltransferase
MTPGQQRAWDSGRYLVEVPRAVATTSVDPTWRLDTAAIFGRQVPVVVEIGSGHGETIVARAVADPERDYLGVEVYRPGLAHTIQRAASVMPGKGGLANLWLIEADAVDLLRTAVAPGSIDELWVFFPDPWQKARHRKRRLITPAFVGLAAAALRDGGVWRLATDWSDYATQMLTVIEDDPSFVNPHGAGAVAPRFDGRPVTSFEAKGRAAGRKVTDLEFVRTSTKAPQDGAADSLDV